MMKKIALLFLLVLGLAAFSAANAGNLAVGTDLGLATLKYDFTSNFSGQLGGAYVSATGGSATLLAVKGDFNLAKAGNVQPTLGIYVTSSSGSLVTGTTNIGITWGVMTMVQNNLSLGADITLLNIASTGGTNTTVIMNGAFVTAAYYL